MTIARYVMVIYALVELIVVSIMHRLTMAIFRPLVSQFLKKPRKGDQL
jgi:hypothetical protein